MFEGLERITFQPGEPIFQEGDEGECAYLIESGSVEVSIFRDKENFKVGELGIYDLFGEMALIDKQPRMATVTALEETRVVSIPRNLIDIKLTNVDPVIEHLLRLVLKRFRQSHHSLVENDQYATEIGDKGLDEELSRTHENVIFQVQTASDIQEALRRDEFQLHYQPIKSIKDNKVVGFEALIRWEHPEYGLTSPIKFIEVAESTDQIFDIGIWTLKRIVHDFNKLFRETQNSSKQEPLFVNVNMSARQLAKADHIAQFANILNKAKVDPNCIRLEISEKLLSGLLNHAQMLLSALRKQGFRLSLDNFGTGNSGLSHLQKLPVENIKIDKSFINHMLSDFNSMQIVKAAISLAKAMELGVVAEGVENMEEYEQLIKLDCSHAQGHYIGRPMPLDDAIKYYY